MDEELLEKVNEYSNVTNNLFEYFSNPDRDENLFEFMLHLYDKYFYIIERCRMGSTLASHCEELIKKFNSISGLVTTCLLQRDAVTNETVGHKLLQSALENKSEIIRMPSLLQYYFYERCKSSNIPFKPLEAFVGFTNAAVTLLDNTVQISRSIGRSIDADMSVKNSYVLYAIEHELQHLRHRLVDPINTKDGRLLNLYSKVQLLEDGFELGTPSHHIGQHAEFPDEVRADYDACKETYKVLATDFNLPTEELEMIKVFLKMQSKKLVVKATEQEMLPEEYLDYFIQKRLHNNDNLTETEIQKVAIFLHDYQSIQESQM